MTSSQKTKLILLGIVCLIILSSCSDRTCIYNSKECYRYGNGIRGNMQISCEKDYDYYYVVGIENNTQFKCLSERGFD